MTTSLTQTEALDIIFSYKSGLNRRGEMGRDDIFFERDVREGLRAATELSRCVNCILFKGTAKINLATFLLKLMPFLKVFFIFNGAISHS